MALTVSNRSSTKCTVALCSLTIGLSRIFLEETDTNILSNTALANHADYAAGPRDVHECCIQFIAWLQAAKLQTCIAQHSITQHVTAQRSPAWHSAEQHGTEQHNPAQCSTTQHSTAQQQSSTTQHSTTQPSTAQQGQESNMMGKHLLQSFYFLLVGREHFAVQPGTVFRPLHVQQCINQLQSPMLGS